MLLKCMTVKKQRISRRTRTWTN